MLLPDESERGEQIDDGAGFQIHAHANRDAEEKPGRHAREREAQRRKAGGDEQQRLGAGPRAGRTEHRIHDRRPAHGPRPLASSAANSHSDQHQAGNRPARARNLRSNDAGAEQLHREAVEEEEHRPVRQPVKPGTLRVRIGRLPAHHHPAHRCHRRLDVIEIGRRGGEDDNNRHIRHDDQRGRRQPRPAGTGAGRGQRETIADRIEPVPGFLLVSQEARSRRDREQQQRMTERVGPERDKQRSSTGDAEADQLACGPGVAAGSDSIEVLTGCERRQRRSTGSAFGPASVGIGARSISTLPTRLTSFAETWTAFPPARTSGRAATGAPCAGTRDREAARRWHRLRCPGTRAPTRRSEQLGRKNHRVAPRTFGTSKSIAPTSSLLPSACRIVRSNCKRPDVA